MKASIQSTTSVTFGTLAALLLALLPFGVPAQDFESGDDGFEIVRDATELPDIIRDQDPDLINTALVLTNQGGPRAVAYCVAFNAAGEKIGRAWVKVPANGLRIVLASDVTAGIDFVGSLRCIARGHLVGSAFIVGPGLTDATVNNAFHWGESRIRAQAVVSY